jgi:predicted DNA-binding WGR domain protein
MLEHCAQLVFLRQITPTCSFLVCRRSNRAHREALHGGGRELRGLVQPEEWFDVQIEVREVLMNARALEAVGFGLGNPSFAGLNDCGRAMRWRVNPLLDRDHGLREPSASWPRRRGRGRVHCCRCTTRSGSRCARARLKLAFLTRIDPTRNINRLYVVEVIPSLFGEWTVMREWGRRGSPGTVRLSSYQQHNEAETAERRMIKRRLQHGYMVEKPVATLDRL